MISLKDYWKVISLVLTLSVMMSYVCICLAGTDTAENITKAVGDVINGLDDIGNGPTDKTKTESVENISDVEDDLAEIMSENTVNSVRGDVYSLRIAAENGKVGDTITVTVSIPSRANGTGAVGGSFNLVYDNAKMNLVEATTGELISGCASSLNPNFAPNKIRLSFAGTSELSANGGALVTAKFKYKAAGTAIFSAEDLQLCGFDLSQFYCTDSSKSVTITSASTTVSVTGVSLNKSSATLNVGDTTTLTATVAPSNATNKNVTWTSSNTAVATVSNGVVTAKKAGTATITVKTADGNKTATCSVTVKAATPEKTAVLSVVNAVGSAGKTVDVVVNLENNPGIAILDFDLGYDSSVMTLKNVTVNNVFSSSDVTAGVLSKNPYKFSAMKLSNASASGKLATFTFAIKEDCADGDYAVTLSNISSYNVDEKAVTITGKNGIVTVEEVIDENAPQIVVSNVTGRAGKTVEVPIIIKNNPGIAVLRFAIKYDNSAMALQSIAANDIFSSSEITEGNILNNPYIFSSLPVTSNILKNGTLITLTLKINENCSEGDYRISLANQESYNVDEEDIKFTLVGGSVTIKNVEPGDVTGDGIVNSRDLLRLGKYLAGWDVELDMVAADVTGDGTVNSRDLLRLGKYLAGWDVKLGE